MTLIILTIFNILPLLGTIKFSVWVMFSRKIIKESFYVTPAQSQIMFIEKKMTMVILTAIYIFSVPDEKEPFLLDHIFKKSRNMNILE